MKGRCFTSTRVSRKDPYVSVQNTPLGKVLTRLSITKTLDIRVIYVRSKSRVYRDRTFFCCRKTNQRNRRYTEVKKRSEDNLTVNI